MPAAVAVPLGVAALGAASKYGAATSGAKAAREAAAAQERSTAAALEYQKSRDVIGDSRVDKRFQLYQDAVNEWRQRNGGAARGGGGLQGGHTIADFAGMQPAAPAQPQPQQAGSVADVVGGWNNWQRYGA